MKIRTLLLGIFAILAFTACDDFLDITPTGKVIATTGDEYRALLTYEYNKFTKDRYMTTLLTDELNMDVKNSKDADKDAYLDLWLWKENPSLTTSYFSWREYYHSIYIANYIIEHRFEIIEATSEEINQLVGEAYMMRAYSHFLLVNLYAEPYAHCNPATTRGVPMMLAADVNAIPRSSSVEDVYRQVLNDIAEAENYLNVEKWEEGKNYRFNKISAQALRARTYLYMGEWQKSLDAAKAVLQVYNEIENLAINDCPLPNSHKSVESIVSLERFSSNMYTVINMPSRNFINMYRKGDLRIKKFFKRVTTTTYSLLKGGTDECVSSFRTSEMYLTAAEASARLGETGEAVNYLIPLMEKRLDASGYSTTKKLIDAMDNEQLIQEILDERARELAFEGHRWNDLRRTTQPELTHSYDYDKNGKFENKEGGEQEIYTLTPDKYTMRFPTSAVEANPEIEIWDK